MKRSAYAKTALLFAMLLGGTAFQGDGTFGCSAGPVGGNGGPDGGTGPGAPPDGGPGKDGQGPRNQGPDGGGKMDPPPDPSQGANLASCTCKDGKTFAGCIAADCSSQSEREKRCAETCGASGMASTSCQLKAEMCSAPNPPPQGEPPGANLASCTCKDGKTFAGCIAADCSSQADREKKCAEACGGSGVAMTTCQLKAEMCAAPNPLPPGDMPGANLASCSCKSGKMYAACIAADCSSQADREKKCAEACGGSGVAMTSCQLRAAMCMSPPPPPPEPQPNRAKCTCKDGKTFEGCVPFDCSVAADRESKCAALCGTNGGFGSSSCELKSSMCAGK